jgi:hypothetical protein
MIARFYNQGIEVRIATFETQPLGTANIERLLIVELLGEAAETWDRLQAASTSRPALVQAVKPPSRCATSV